MNVLIIEDEARVADFIQRGLRSEGWIVTVVPDAEAGLALIERDSFDVVVLDLMLPGMSGQDMCRQMRARRNLTPVLMLTALGALDDRVAGLRLGADDYLAKPFDFDELVARLEALARRRSGFQLSADDKRILAVDPIQLDTESLEVLCGGERVDLTTKEREILALFLASPGKVFSRERILNAVWGASADPLTNVVDVYVGRLRKKLGSAGYMIETVRGAGYRLANRP
ncbi:MAG: response regulator transcription factor [Alphaproteobacteria bacterium]|nr:response regulator transcription factor [Alphaproteobacteria bacterium]